MPWECTIQDIFWFYLFCLFVCFRLTDPVPTMETSIAPRQRPKAGQAQPVAGMLPIQPALTPRKRANAPAGPAQPISKWNCWALHRFCKNTHGVKLRRQKTFLCAHQFKHERILFLTDTRNRMVRFSWGYNELEWIKIQLAKRLVHLIDQIVRNQFSRMITPPSGTQIHWNSLGEGWSRLQQ